MPDGVGFTLPPGTGGLAINSECNGEPIVTIRYDGTVEVNPKYTTTEAAQAFWDAVQEIARVHRARGPFQ